MRNTMEFFDPDKAIHVSSSDILFAITKFYYLPSKPAKITADPYYSFPEEPEEFEVLKAMIWDEENKQWNEVSDSQIEMLQEDGAWAGQVMDAIRDWIEEEGERYEQGHNS